MLALAALDLLRLLERWDSGCNHSVMHVILDSVTGLETNATNTSPLLLFYLNALYPYRGRRSLCFARQGTDMCANCVRTFVSYAYSQ